MLITLRPSRVVLRAHSAVCVRRMGVSNSDALVIRIVGLLINVMRARCFYNEGAREPYV
jgi:hypothetical protein